MPHAIVIHCLAREPVEAGALNGGQLQGAFLDLVRNVDAELSAELHQGNTLRNYALSIIRPRPFDDFVYDSGPHKRQSRLREIGFRVACLDDRIYP
ncbi:MAG: hypothetical protein L0229_22195, partial [Blastocatellia bacterium]|nr:hypothetical protein [Blastocatellia bacterium]